jgi:hypothetical protein
MRAGHAAPPERRHWPAGRCTSSPVPTHAVRAHAQSPLGLVRRAPPSPVPGYKSPLSALPRALPHTEPPLPPLVLTVNSTPRSLASPTRLAPACPRTPSSFPGHLLLRPNPQLASVRTPPGPPPGHRRGACISGCSLSQRTLLALALDHLEACTFACCTGRATPSPAPENQWRPSPASAKPHHWRRPDPNSSHHRNRGEPLATFPHSSGQPRRRSRRSPASCAATMP